MTDRDTKKEANGNGHMELPPLSRNAFMKSCFFGVAGAWSVMAAYPVCRYLCPAETEDEKVVVESVTVCKESELPPGSGRNFKFGHKPALVTHTEDGQLHAFIAICSHLGCTVQFNTDKDLIWCACHGGAYDPSTGKNVAGPPPKPLDPLKVAVVDGSIVVSRT
ncbi:MAG: ubiquinol-cytochrome c reductase iron-sulfur subunit [Candidatus Obscuribacterales bacterium]